MKELCFRKYGLFLLFAVDDAGELSILSVSDRDEPAALEANHFFPVLELHTTGTDVDDHHGYKHTGGDVLCYRSHRETEDALVFTLGNDSLTADVVQRELNTYRF